MKVTGYRRWLYGVWATGEVLLFGGLIYGWPSLVFLLKQRHVYSDLCQPDVTLSNNIQNVSMGGGAYEFYPTHLDSSSGGTKSEFVPVSSAAVPHDSSNGADSFNASWPPDSILYGVSAQNGTRPVGTGLQGEGCVEQDAAFALAYTVVTVAQAVGSIAVGQLQRSVGMRLARTATGVTYMAGVLMIGLITPSRPALVFTGNICVAVAGLALLITNVQLGVLFGRGQTTFVGVLSGCYDVSAIVQLVIKTVISAGADYLYTYVGFTVLSCLTLVSTLLWLPRSPVVVMSKQVIVRTVDAEAEALAFTSPSRPDEENHKETSTYVTSTKLWTCLTSPLYVLHVLWFSLLQLRLFFFVGVLNIWLTELTHGNLDDVDHFTNVQLYAGCASVVFAVLSGSLYDYLRHRYKDSPRREDRYLGGAVVPLMLGSVLCCMLSLLSLVPERRALYVTFLLLAAFRSVMYSLAAAFIAITFPAELFGVLYGSLMICAGLVGCLQYPLFIWSESSQHATLHVNVLLLMATTLTILHPLHILWRCRRASPDPPPSPSLHSLNPPDPAAVSSHLGNGTLDHTSDDR